MRVKFGEGTKDVPLSEVNAANYIVPQGEENTYHVLQDIPRFDQRTGKKLSIARIQKYGAKEFREISRILRQQGYELTILYDPTSYLAKKAEEEERRLLVGKKKAELEAKRREAEKAALKAEILAELKEQGIIPSGEEKPAKMAKTKK